MVPSFPQPKNTESYTDKPHSLEFATVVLYCLNIALDDQKRTLRLIEMHHSIGFKNVPSEPVMQKIDLIRQAIVSIQGDHTLVQESLSTLEKELPEMAPMIRKLEKARYII